ncbi:MAG: OmpA family protein [Bacillota bacterium]
MARRRLLIYLLSVLVLGLFFASELAGASFLHSSGLTLEVPEGRAVDPGELVTYCFLLKNETTATIVPRISFAANMDWPLLGETGEIVLPPGVEEAVVISVMVPADALSQSEHRLELTVAWGGTVLTGVVTTVVKARHEIQLVGPKPLTAAPGSTVDLSFILNNAGNVAETCRLTATSAKGWSLSPITTEVTLEAGKVTSVHFRLSIPSDAAETMSDTVSVTVTTQSGRVVTATARVQVGRPILEGIGQVGPESHRFAGEMGLVLDSPDDYLGPPDTWLRLSGPIGAKERMELLLSGQFSPAASLELTLLQYQTQRYRIRIGNLTSSWTGLVSPGTGRAGLDVVFTREESRLGFTLGSSSETIFGPEVAWYGLTWTGSWADWEVVLRYLKNENGANRDELGYLDTSLRRRAAGTTFAADLAMGLAGDSAATLLQYWNTKGPLSWRAGLSWSNGINRPNERLGLNFGLTTPFKGENRLTVELAMTEESGYASADPAVPSIDANRAYELKLFLVYPTGLTLRAAAKETVFLASATGSKLEHRLGFTYTRGNYATSSFWRLEGELVRAAEEAASWAPDYTLILGGTYRFRGEESKGTWTASLFGSLSTHPGATSFFDAGHLRLGLSYETRVPEKNLLYRLTLAEEWALELPGIFTAEAQVESGLGNNGTIAGYARLAENSFSLGLKMVQKFGFSIPRPHATISGLVYQDLDGDETADPEEPGIAGAWVILNGARVVRTAADGRWTMTGVPPGKHEIGILCDFDPTYRSRKGKVSVEVKAGDTVQLSFPVWRLTTLAGRVFVDRDGDDAYGSADRPLTEATVILTRPDGREEKASPAQDGFFSFPDLAPGNYRLSAAIPEELAEEVAAPQEITVAVAQEGWLAVDLIAREKEKPVIITFIAPPVLTAMVEPLAARKGERLRIRLQADVPLNRVEAELAGGPVWSWPVDGEERWSGEIVIPSDYPPGPTVLIIRGWGEAETPGEARVAVTILDSPAPPKIMATIEPTVVAPGEEVTLYISADKPIAVLTISLPGLPPIVYPAQGASWSGVVRIPPEQPPGPFHIAVKAAGEGGQSETATVALEVVNPLRIEATARPERTPLGGSIFVEVKANTPLAGVEVFYDGGRFSLAGNGVNWSGRFRLPNTARAGPFILLVAARGLNGDEATAELLLAVEPVLADELRRIYPFDFDSAELRPEFHPILLQIAAILRANPDVKLKIVGHADAIGSVEYNRGLSLRRAKAVKDFLVKHGDIAPERLIMEGKGEEAPIADNATGAGRARNRRVEFVIVVCDK